MVVILRRVKHKKLGIKMPGQGRDQSIKDGDQQLEEDIIPQVTPRGKGLVRTRVNPVVGSP